MKALTIYQPWASLIAAGAKPFEFRCWPAPRGMIGQRIGIHAAARKMVKIEVNDLLYRLGQPDEAWTTGLVPAIAAPLLERLKSGAEPPHYGCLLGHAVLGQSTKTPAPPGAPDEVMGVEDADKNWAWPLSDFIAFPAPIPCLGERRFWDVPRGLIPDHVALGALT